MEVERILELCQTFDKLRNIMDLHGTIIVIIVMIVTPTQASSDDLQRTIGSVNAAVDVKEFCVLKKLGTGAVVLCDTRTIETNTMAL